MNFPQPFSPQVAVLDANVLYPAPLRDLLMTLTGRGLLSPRWTETIHEEWIRNLLKAETHYTRERLERTKGLMLEHAPQAMVTGHEGLIEGLQLPDLDDRHVLAAAIHAGASLIVTENIKDFPARILEGHGVQAIRPDDFVMALVASRPDLVLASLRLQRARLKKPPSDQVEFLQALEKCRMLKLVAWVRDQPEPI
jgi:PIN domain